MKSSLNEIEQIAEGYFNTALSCHDWDHVKRVHGLAMIIGRKEKADLKIISIAAWLHDIKRSEEMKQNGKICHAKEGAKEAEIILTNLKLENVMVQMVKHCIESHRYRNKIEPKTIEAKVLSDADKLDALGAVGIGRSFLFAGKIGARLHNSEIFDVEKTVQYSPEDTFYREYMVKLRHLKNRMFTKTGRQIAKERTTYMKDFIKRLEAEIRGKI